VVLMVAYFSTQQDISVETDRDDRRRRWVLRMKCLYVVSGCSLFSLVVVVLMLHLQTIDLNGLDARGLLNCLLAWAKCSLSNLGRAREL
jgi:hypothetical protein